MFHKINLPVLMVLALAVSLFATARPALAANQVVSDCGDTGGANQLRAKVTAANSSGGGTITFTCGPSIALLAGVLPNISTNITLDGGNTVSLSGNNASRIFIVNNGATLTLNNITITKGYTNGHDGGAIYSDGTLNVNHSKFLDNHAEGAGGGAVLAYGALTITNSEFGSNSADSGGALYVKWGDGVANITGSNFHDNQTRDTYNGIGGALLIWDGASATINTSTFSTNVAGYGGAIAVHQPTTNPSTLTLTNSTLSQNTASRTGAGIYNYAGTLTLTGSTIAQNNSVLGAGIYTYHGTANLTNVMLTGNLATIGTSGGTCGYWNNGGGIYNDGGTVTMNQVNVSGNQSSVTGGGITNDAGTMTLTDVTLDNNTAKYGAGIWNGVVCYDDPGTLTLNRVTVSNNAAIAGGGIWNENTVNMTNATLSGNSATMSGTGGNSGDGTGGGILNIGTATLLNVTLKGNTASSVGAAITNSSSYTGTVTLTNSLIAKGGSNNSCDGTITGSFNYADDSSCGFVGGGHIVADLKLGPLANNGGLTKTHLLQSGSVAIDNGSGGSCPSTDQRNINRPQGLACDVGAVEVQPTTPTATRTNTATPTRTNTPTRTLTNTPTRTLTPSSTQTRTVTTTPTLACGKPAKPTLNKPANGSSMTKTRVKLKWSAVNCAINYQVVVRMDTKKGQKVDAVTVTKNSRKTPILAQGHTYYWSVKACNAANECSKSAVWSFTLQ